MGRDGSGVTPRKTSIQLAFTWMGQPRRETLKIDGRPLPPTQANLRVAHRTMKDINAALSTGTFDYAQFFPHSKHAARSGGLTFGKACDEWLQSKGRLATKTLNQYRNALEVWKGLFGRDTPLASMRHAAMAARVGSHPWASAKLLNNYLICLRGVFRLHGRDLNIADPTDGIKNAKHQKPPPDPLTEDERERVLADMREHYDQRVWAYFLFAFMTGMRPEELIALRWSDIDWNDRTARVQRAKTQGQLGDLKTYHVRDVDLANRAVDALKVMKAYTFMGSDDKAEVFQNPVTGAGWHDERSQRDHYWKPSLKRLGIRARRAYVTRHTYATTALMRGLLKPAYIARQMGHKSTKMLFDTYAKWIDGADQKRERALLDATMSGGIAPESHGEASSPK
jgi:integrase